MRLQLDKPKEQLNASISLPGSKSISNRVLMIRALSGLAFELSNCSDSDDTLHLQKALQLITEKKSGVIDVDHAGTDMRFLTAYLATREGSYELTGSERMKQRPVRDLVDVLKYLGADISYRDQKGYPPLLIRGKRLEGGQAKIKGNISSQFISALLLIAPYLEKGLELRIEGDVVSKPYIEMTVHIMQAFGADVVWKENMISVKPVPYAYTAATYAIESDWSAASYFYSLVTLSPLHTRIVLKGLFKESLQADAVCAMLYESFGVETEFGNGEAGITKTALARTEPLTYDFIHCPDIAQTLACSCVALQRPFYFTGLQTLKVKETDRIVALKQEFEKLGVMASATDTTLGCQVPHLAKDVMISVATYKDHRMAMSFAPLALITGSLQVEEAEVVSKSYPQFWSDLEKTGMIIRTV